MQTPPPLLATDDGLRKRKRYLGLILPNLVMVALLIGYPIYWVAAREVLLARLDQTAADLGRAGYSVTRTGQSVGGFPFRLHLHFDRLRVAGPSGWGVDAQNLDAQAYLHAPGRWVLVAGQGLTLLRGPGGGVSVQGSPLRASIAGMKEAPWRIVVEGEGVRFQPLAQARPFTLTRAERIDVLLRPAPDRTGGQIMARITKGVVSPQSALKPLTGQTPLTLDLAIRITRPDRFKGKGWAATARAWAKDGGRFQLVRLRAEAGAASLSADAGAVTADDQGRWSGALPLRLSLPLTTALLPMRISGPAEFTVRLVAVAAALARGAGGRLPLTLTFSGGRIGLNGLPIGAAPRLYTPANAVSAGPPAAARP